MTKKVFFPRIAVGFFLKNSQTLVLVSTQKQKLSSKSYKYARKQFFLMNIYYELCYIFIIIQKTKCPVDWCSYCMKNWIIIPIKIQIIFWTRICQQDWKLGGKPWVFQCIFEGVALVMKMDKNNPFLKHWVWREK